MNKIRVVVVGGGNGAAVSILALKRNPDLFQPASIINMCDSGGSSGRLREEFNTLPPGDILRALLAMSKYDYYTLRQIFYEKRFTESGKLNDHNLGNLILTLFSEYSKKYPDTLAAMAEALECVGEVAPVTYELSQLVAELSNGEVVEGEVHIDRPAYRREHIIKKVYLKPVPTLSQPAERLLRDAEYIIFGPGSLYTSIIPNVLVQGFNEAVAKSKAKLVFVVGNGYEAEGETGPMTMSGFTEVLQQYIPRPLDMIIYNTHDLGAVETKFYQEKKWAVAKRDMERLSTKYTLVGRPFERAGGGLSKEKLAEIFKELLVSYGTTTKN